MAETKVRRPDGVEVTVSHPEGATEEEIFAFAEYQSNRDNSGGAQPRTAPVGEDLSWQRPWTSYYPPLGHGGIRS